ncbi:hypothetical protein DDI_1926 [Dickeya dianthicola RNS04.9]|nr:hypothetical protein DDI_1926 [Dickeya dianthicola RNS04.9]
MTVYFTQRTTIYFNLLIIFFFLKLIKNGLFFYHRNQVK